MRNQNQSRSLSDLLWASTSESHTSVFNWEFCLCAHTYDHIVLHPRSQHLKLFQSTNRILFASKISTFETFSVHKPDIVCIHDLIQIQNFLKWPAILMRVRLHGLGCSRRRRQGFSNANRGELQCLQVTNKLH